MRVTFTRHLHTTARPLLALLAIACADSTAPAAMRGVIGEYELMRVDGAAPPATFYEGADGTRTVHSANVMLRPDGQYTVTALLTVTFTNGTPSRTGIVLENGNFTVSQPWFITFTIPRTMTTRELSYKGTITRRDLKYVLDGTAFEFRRRPVP